MSRTSKRLKTVALEDTICMSNVLFFDVIFRITLTLWPPTSILVISCHESTSAEKDPFQVRMISFVFSLQYKIHESLQQVGIYVCFWPVAMFDLALPKKKIKEERKKKKMRPIKMESEEVCDVHMSAASMNSGLADAPTAPPQTVKEE